MYVIDKKDNSKFAVFIEEMNNENNIPLKKNGWLFDWRSALKNQFSIVYVLRLKEKGAEILGLIELLEFEGMLFMNLIEVSPKNRGASKKYERIAGNLIAFGCRQSYLLDSNYKGFLLFESKTQLIDIYKKKYGAEQIVGQKIAIGPSSSKSLINSYINEGK